MIGILPAAGQATRLHGLPKFLLPTGDSFLLKRHVELMEKANPDDIYIGANPTNAPLLREYASFANVYEPHDYATMSETVLGIKYRGLFNDTLFGMPDTYIEDDQCYAKLAQLLEDGADVAVGVFRTRPEQRSKLGMCFVHRGRVMQVIDKPQETTFELAWGALAWKPVFWQYLNPSDPHVGYAIPRAIEAGLSICAVAMNGGYWDCGTPDEYFDLITHLHLEKA